MPGPSVHCLQCSSSSPSFHLGIARCGPLSGVVYNYITTLVSSHIAKYFLDPRRAREGAPRGLPEALKGPPDPEPANDPWRAGGETSLLRAGSLRPLGGRCSRKGWSAA